MIAKLSDEQRAAIAALPNAPVQVVDDDASTTYYLVEEARLRQLKDLARSQREQEAHRQLRGAIQDGLASPNLSEEQLRVEVERHVALRRLGKA